MFVKTKSAVNEMRNVRFINGLVTLGKMKLNALCFEVDGILIDTGSQSLFNEFKHFFDQADVDKVVITHHHEDHTGGAAYLQKEYELPIYMNEISIEECRQKSNYPLYRKLFWGRRRPFYAHPIGKTFTSRNATWDVIETPGHSKDHLSFLNRETGQLFSGDLYVHPKTKLILRDEDIPTIIKSIETVLTYDFTELFCCHAGYMKDGRQALTRKLNYLTDLQENILSLHKKGYSEQEIQAQMFKKKYPIMYFSFGEWGTIHIIRSILHSN